MAFFAACMTRRVLCLQGTSSDILVILSNIHSQLRGDTSGVKNEDSAQVLSWLQADQGSSTCGVLKCPLLTVRRCTGLRSLDNEVLGEDDGRDGREASHPAAHARVPV